MTRPFTRAAVLATGLALVSSAAFAQGGEVDYLKRFNGTFAGNGSASRSEGENPVKVKCTMKGSSSATAVNMNGTCRAAIIFSRKIGANLKVDGAGRYTGVYTGSTIGPAALSGRRRGDAVVLTITWPKEVRGDTTAQMTIQNAGNGKMSIVITDEVSKGGPKAQVSSMALTKS